MSVQFDIAICHSPQDSQIAATIVKGMRVRGVTAWLDPEPLLTGVTPVSIVEDLARHSRIVLYLCSPAIFDRVWVQYESPALYNRSIDRSDLTVIPVKVARCVLPPMYAHYAWADLTVGDFNTGLDRLATAVQRILRKRSIFICHSSKDKAMVRTIVSELRSVDGLSLWYDEDSLRPGSIIRRGIESGIANADYLLAIISQHSIDTIQGWIGFELDQAYEIERARNLAGRYFAIPVLIESGVSVPGWLSTKVYVDLTKDFTDGIRAIVSAFNDTPPRRMNGRVDR